VATHSENYGKEWFGLFRSEADRKILILIIIASIFIHPIAQLFSQYEIIDVLSLIKAQCQLKSINFELSWAEGCDKLHVSYGGIEGCDTIWRVAYIDVVYRLYYI
jgi:hypothetical protein